MHWATRLWSIDFLHDLGRRTAIVTAAESRSFNFVTRRLSVAFQRGSAVSVNRTAGYCGGLD